MCVTVTVYLLQSQYTYVCDTNGHSVLVYTMFCSIINPDLYLKQGTSSQTVNMFVPHPFINFFSIHAP